MVWVALFQEGMAGPSREEWRAAVIWHKEILVLTWFSGDSWGGRALQTLSLKLLSTYNL